MNWTDPKTNELTRGFRELGFLPEAFVNLLAMLGWNDGTEQEIFSMAELVEKFSMDRVHKNGAKFDYEKAKWYNHEWIKHYPVSALKPAVQQSLEAAGIAVTDSSYLDKVITLVKDRCTFITDFPLQAGFLFTTPQQYDLAAVQPKWNDQKELFFAEAIRQFQLLHNWDAPSLEHTFKELAAAHKIKPGDVLMPLRVMLVGGKFGPAVFDIAALLGKEASIERIKHFIALLKA